MAQDIVDPSILDGNIEEVCEQLNKMSKRERDMKTNARTDVVAVEREIFIGKLKSKDVI